MMSAVGSAKSSLPSIDDGRAFRCRGGALACSQIVEPEFREAVMGHRAHWVGVRQTVVLDVAAQAGQLGNQRRVVLVPVDHAFGRDDPAGLRARGQPGLRSNS